MSLVEIGINKAETVQTQIELPDQRFRSLMDKWSNCQLLRSIAGLPELRSEVDYQHFLL